VSKKKKTTKYRPAHGIEINLIQFSFVYSLIVIGFQNKKKVEHIFSDFVVKLSFNIDLKLLLKKKT
jgi:hypothetical protein